MYRYCTYLALLVSAGQAHPSRSTETSTKESPSDNFPLSEDICLFGEFPSLACKAKCDAKNQEAYCDENDPNFCLCRDSKIQDPGDLMSLHSHLEGIAPDIGSSLLNLGHDIGNTETQSDDAPLIEDVCILGEFPPIPCTLKCEAMNKEAYCDKKQDRCLCRDRELSGLEGLMPVHDHLEWVAPTVDLASFSGLGQEPVKTDEINDQPDDGSFLTTFFFLDLSDFFGYNSTDDADSVYNETSTDGSSTQPSDETHDKVAAGWFTPHIIALLIVILLSALILLELIACYRKRKDRNRMDMIFPSSPTGISQKS